MSTLIAAGVADLLGSLHEADKKQTSRNGDAASSNPFHEALKEAEGASSADKATTSKVASSKSQSETAGNGNSNSSNVSSSENAVAVGAGSSSVKPAFLFVGNFPGQSGVAAMPAVQTQGQENMFEFPGSGKQSFGLSIILRTQDGQESVTFGDLNGDGIPDLIVTNKATSKAYIYLGNADGKYELFTDLSGGIGASSATIADFNNDGSTDIAVAYLTDNRIVLDGKGLRKGIFFPTTYLNMAPYAIFPHDFNGDGLEDLLVMNYEDFSASIYLNQGSATFVQSQQADPSSVNIFQAKLDLNGDFIDDLVYIQYLDDHVTLVMQDGKDGSIKNLGGFILNPSSFLVLGDFNGDGLVDVALARK